MRQTSVDHGEIRATVDEVGFAVIPAVLTTRECDELVAEIENSSLRTTKAGVRHAMQNSAVAEIARCERLLRIARIVLEGGAQPFRATLFDKSPSANWFVAWHQDRALPLRERIDVPGWGPWSNKDGIVYANAPAAALSRVLALRLHLDDSNFNNGPLKVLPGTHLNGVLTDDEIQELAWKVQPVTCVVGRGGLMVMRPQLVHASSKSQSDAPRRVLHIEYAASLTLEVGLELAIA